MAQVYSIDKMSSSFGANGCETAGLRLAISVINEAIPHGFRQKNPEKGHKTIELRNFGQQKAQRLGWALCTNKNWVPVSDLCCGGGRRN